MNKIINFIFRIKIAFASRLGFAKNLMQWGIRFTVLILGFRKILNWFYQRLNNQNKLIFHLFFAKIFRNQKTKKTTGFWQVSFLNKTLKMPLSGDNLWLKWDSAISILGHDLEIKETYKNLIKRLEIKCFADIGANYGTHSLLFLSQNISTFSLEPNPACNAYFESACKLNHFNSKLINIGLGDKNERAKIAFPKTETWLGSFDLSVQQKMANMENVESIEVEIKTLDDFFSSKNILPDLIKIDTEGFENKVILGGKNIIQKKQPIIIFENNKQERTKKIFETFEQLNYSICTLPISEKLETHQLDFEAFKNHSQTNFAAISKQNSKIKILNQSL